MATLKHVWSRVWRMFYVAFVLLVLCATWLLLPKIAFGQTPTPTPAYLPDGTVRNPGDWYYCYDGGTTTSNSLSNITYDAPQCTQLLWQESTGGGGVYESLLMEGAIFVEGIGIKGARVRGWAVPAKGIKSFEYKCSAVQQYCRVAGGGSSTGLVNSSDGPYHTANGTNWSLSAPAPTSYPNCETSTLNVVAEFESEQFDRWWTHPERINAFWNADGLTISESRTQFSSFSCSVIGWESWDTPWYPPTPEVTPTPTPCLPGMGCWQVGIVPITPIAIGTIAVPTVQTTVTWGIGTPVVVGCYNIIPSTAHTVETWFGEYPVGFDGVEMCTRERSLSLQLDEFDFGAWAVGLFSFMGMGVLWTMISRR